MEPLKILVQEADADIRNVLQIILEEFQYQVLTLVNCRDLTETIQSFKPHLVILDFRFSGKESIEACIKIKLLYPNLPVIALSCNSNIKNLFSINGFDNYISKPFDIDQLLDIIRKHINYSKGAALYSPLAKLRSEPNRSSKLHN